MERWRDKLGTIDRRHDVVADWMHVAFQLGRRDIRVSGSTWPDRSNFVSSRNESRAADLVRRLTEQGQTGSGRA